MQKFMQDMIQKMIHAQNLTAEQMRQIMQAIMTGKAHDVFMTAFLVALRMKGETVEEMTSAAKVMRSLAIPVHCQDPHAIDIVGTGGDHFNLFNVSTASALICATANVTVAKHGSRSFSSSTGSADVLEAAGLSLQLNASQLAACLDQHQLCFMFAPNHHASMHYIAPIRKQLGVRTFMNLLGPLANPAQVTRIVIGVYDVSYAHFMAQIFADLGGEHAIVVHSEEGLDEISPAKQTSIVEYKAGAFHHWRLNPKEIGIQHHDLDGLQVSDAKTSLHLIQDALSGEKSTPMLCKARDMLALNAGVALYVSGCVKDWKQGVELAVSVIQSGQVMQKFESLVQFTQQIEKLK
ncbi:MAG: anthranilate phosphoribosyltransferase [Endozoicomonadaceae bacterium]|nr:anthranilate phosphoribosyltransferase [Endozoicomonadaceae bacterium]